jgi:uracil-DNA glycosylase family 4
MTYSPEAHGARCDICPLKGRTVVPPTVHPSPQFIVVGEGPGRVEERLGAPFVGASGKLLDTLLRSNGLRRDHAHITNAALCRGESDKENDKAAECCAPRLLRELGSVTGAARATLLLGKTATRSVLGVSSILAARGFVWTAPEVKVTKQKATPQGELRAATLAGRQSLAGRTFFPSIHPAFVLRADTWHPIIKIDFERFSRYLKDPAFALQDEAPYSTTLESLKGLAKVVSLDIETDGIRVLETKILCVQISDGERTTVLWPWKRKYATPLSRFLKTRDAVVCHNGYNFDQIVLMRHGVK